LGEKGLWAKTTNYELDTRVPLIIAAPGKVRGVISNELVELVDLYPSLAELSGLPVPEGLEGTSLAPLLTRPEQTWKSAVFSQFPRPWQYKGEPEIMGYAIRTDRYRYVEWRNFKTGEVKATELYDHQVDAVEVNNIAGIAANTALVEQLKQQLRDGWQMARPARLRSH
jgi:iduronate 2-sulfatase